VDGASVDGLLDLVRKRQHDSHPGWAANWLWRHWRRLSEPLRVALADVVELPGEERGAPTTPSEWQDGGAKSRQSAKLKRGSGPEWQANRPGLKDAVLPD
jgi:hypothetical protein